MGHEADRIGDDLHELLLAMQRLPGYASAWRELLGRVLRLGGAVEDVAFADEDLARLRCPVHYLWGSHDPFGDTALGRAVAASTPGSLFEVVGRGHLPWIDAPDACAERIEHARTSGADVRGVGHDRRYARCSEHMRGAGI